MTMDDVDIEGAITRNLFRTDSDTDEDEEDVDLGSTEEEESNSNEDTDTDNPSNGSGYIVRREVMHVVLEEQQTGSIAQRLWPAAEYLAKFVLEVDSSSRADDLNETSRSFSSDRKEPVLDALKELLGPQNTSKVLPIIELGAGVGLTGMELATQLSVKVLLTDLEVGLPLLQTNAVLNQESYRLGMDAVTVQKLGWGEEEDYQKALDWYHELVASTAIEMQLPLLILGSDCVYWECLHEPLEDTLCKLLSSAPPGSMCLLANMRRWKRDNTFYQSIGKRTRTPTHELQCTCLQETVRRDVGSEQREIMRVFAVQWVERERERERNGGRRGDNDKGKSVTTVYI
jgi:hypothetical protein